MDLVGVELPGFDEFLDLGHARFPTGGDHRVEVACSLATHEIARCVTYAVDVDLEDYH